MINRKIDYVLDEFFELNHREALLIDGARQVGKTWSIRAFGRRHFRHVVEINFIKTQGAKALFSGVLNEVDLFVKISALTDEEMVPGETLIFFDEVQECPEIVTYIKFLVDEGSYRYVLSGSLLGVELKDLRSAPVGYLREVKMYPLDFEEFLFALGLKRDVFEHVKSRLEKSEAVDPVVHDKLKGIFRTYLVVGGMPAAVDTFVRTKSVSKVVDVQKGILNEYRKDATKYDLRDKLKILNVLDLLPEELNRPNKRFIVSELKAGSRYEREEGSFLWLEKAGIALSVRSVADPRIPLRLSRRSNFFKLFLNDVGLLSALYMDGIQSRILSEETDVNFGSVYENFVAQELTAHGFRLYYFNSEERRAEVDFLIEKDGRVLPIEVKSGKNYKTHESLNHLLSIAEYGIERALVVSNANSSGKGAIRYLPVYSLMFLSHDGLPEDDAVRVSLPTADDIVFRPFIGR